MRRVRLTAKKLSYNKQPSIGVFASHIGWNSVLESLSCGVAFLCLPFFAEQQNNCGCSCSKWDIGREIKGDVKRDQVGKLFREVMEGERGK
ncbi:hypothetical protein NC651_035830 [Populus alba x Populus x berolinensis]|nr:hypothetical protein NC651_035830 [Populus alba x Populus x berolinensis]